MRGKFGVFVFVFLFCGVFVSAGFFDFFREAPITGNVVDNSTIGACDADVNDDGVVNTFDLLVVRANLGENVSYPGADINDDGVVNILDLLGVRSFMGQPCEISCTDAGYVCTSGVRGCGQYNEKDNSCAAGSGVICCEDIPSCGDGVCFEHNLSSYGENCSSCVSDCGVCGNVTEPSVCDFDANDLFYGCDFPISEEECSNLGLGNYVDKNYSDVKFKCCSSGVNFLSCYFDGVAPVVDQTVPVDGGNQTNLTLSIGSDSGNASSVTELFPCLGGCVLDDLCYDIGSRKDFDYCSSMNGSFVSQLVNGSECVSSFECVSNFCVDETCVDAGLFKRIFNWFSRVFG